MAHSQLKVTKLDGAAGCYRCRLFMWHAFANSLITLPLQTTGATWAEEQCPCTQVPAQLRCGAQQSAQQDRGTLSPWGWEPDVRCCTGAPVVPLRGPTSQPSWALGAEIDDEEGQVGCGPGWKSKGESSQRGSAHCGQAIGLRDYRTAGGGCHSMESLLRAVWRALVTNTGSRRSMNPKLLTPRISPARTPSCQPGSAATRRCEWCCQPRRPRRACTGRAWSREGPPAQTGGWHQPGGPRQRHLRGKLYPKVKGSQAVPRPPKLSSHPLRWSRPRRQGWWGPRIGSEIKTGQSRSGRRPSK